MPIFAEAQERLFRIRTAHTEYQMCADSYGVLKHLWYGVPVGHSMDYLRKYPDVGFAGNLYEAGNDRTYSLNTLPQEYAGAGVGDYRISAANVRHADAARRWICGIRAMPSNRASTAFPDCRQFMPMQRMRKRWRSPCGMPHPAWKLSCNTAFCRNWTSSPEALCSGIPAHPLWFCRRQPACVWTCRTAHGSGCTSTVDTPWSGCRSGQRCSTACRRAPAQEALPAISRTPLRFCVRRTAQSRTAAASAHF